MSNKNDGKPETGEKTETVEETPEPTLDDLLSELKLSDQGKKMLTMIISGVANNIKEISNRLDGLEKQPAAENPDIYAGLSPEQKYQVMMAKASAPAAAAQQGVLQALLTRVGGGGSGGGDFSNLLKSAETIQGLRSVLFPEPSPLQLAMEKAQVAQVLSQTRLMNKVAGKATSDYLDKIESDLLGTQTEAEAEAEAA